MKLLFSAVLSLLPAAILAGSFPDTGDHIVTFDDAPEGPLSAEWNVWKDRNLGRVFIDPATGYKDTNSLKMAGAKAASVHRDVPVKPGEVVTLEVLCRQSGAGKPAFAVGCLDAAGAVSSEAGSYEGKFRTFEGDWRRAQVKVLVPGGVAFLRLVLSAEKQVSKNDAVWFDELKITREGPVSVPAVAPNDRAPKVKVELTEADYVPPATNLEALHTMRMSVLKHSDVEGDERVKWITPAKAAAYAKKLREAGYNIVLTEGQRYLMCDTRDHAPFPDVVAGSLPFPDLVANTKVIADACHAEDLRVYLHLTAGLTSKESLTAHPERMALSVDNGRPRPVWGIEWMCLNNPNLQEEYFKRLDKLLAATKADGLMVDETSMMMDSCGCEHCRAKFAADTKLQMPPQGTPWLGDLSNPAYRAFLEWRLKLCVDYNQRIRDTLRKYNPQGELITYYATPHNPTCWYDHGCSLEMAGEISRPLGLEMISNYSKYWPLFIANMKAVRSVAEHGDGDVFAITNPPDYDGIYQHWLLSLSQGVHQYWPWYVAESVKEERKPLVQWEMKNKDLLAGLRAAAETGVVTSTRNNNLHRNPLGSVKLQNSYFAVANTLTMGQVPYKALGDMDLEKSLTGKAGTIIALNLALVSEAQAEKLRQFVKDGGTLVTALDFSLYDENGEMRKNFALADLLGCDYLATIEGDGILTIPEKVPLLGDVTGEFACPDVMVSVKPHEGTQVLGTIAVGSGAPIPGLLRREVGKGQVIYFASHIEPLLYFNELNGTQIVQRSYGDGRDENLEKLLLSLVRNSAREKVKVFNIPPGVVVESFDHNFKGTSGFAVSLLNYTGMLTDGRPEAQRVGYSALKLPEAEKPIRITWKGPAEKAFAISPDFEGKKELTLLKDDSGVSVEIPSFGNFLMVFFE